METLIFNQMLAGPDWGYRSVHQFVSYDQALQQPVKIAALMAFFDSPWWFCYDSNIANLDFSQFDLILLSSIEPSNPDNIAQWASTKNFKRFLISAGSLERGRPLPPDTIYRPWWAFNIVNTNKKNQADLSTKKTFFFDVLLGARRKHRDFIMGSLEQRNLLDRNIVSYRDIFPGVEIPKTSTSHFPDLPLQWPYISPALTPDLEVKETLDKSISSIVPWKIYQHSYFSIIAETLGTGGAFFLSEKTGKAFYARRAFVHFGIWGFLAQLKELGFQTFSTVWDESYDDIEDDVGRWQRAMDTVEYIMKQDPDQILAACQDILEHNFYHLLELKAQSRKQQIKMIQECL